MNDTVDIKEIFESIQGEGPYIGVNQLFVRFSKCNLYCKYCDTDFISLLKEYSFKKLSDEINKYANIHSVSLTGGEPLLYADFLKKMLPLVKTKIYLETNGTLYKELAKIIDYTDIIAMDIKLPSATGMGDFFTEHEKFIDIAVKHKKEIFVKVVFDEHITQDEIINIINIVPKYNVLVVLQPKMDGEVLKISSDFINKIYYEFVSRYKNVRLIPQVHKFLNVR